MADSCIGCSVIREVRILPTITIIIRMTARHNLIHTITAPAVVITAASVADTMAALTVAADSAAATVVGTIEFEK